MTDQFQTENLAADQTIIVGAGVAGLFTALKMAPKPVTILTASPLGSGSSSTWAQGGLAAAMGDDDSADLHYEDTINAGGGVVDEPAARILVDEGPARVRDLIEMGIEFDQDEQGNLKLGREAAHSRNRIVHASGDRAGMTIMNGLIKAAQDAEHITIKEGIVAEDLVYSEEGAIFGVLAYDIEAKSRVIFTAPRTVLATGGIGGLFSITTNPVHAQGHGIAMAYRAGAEIMDPEFVQFHPTALDVGIDPAPLATEALRGEGARIVDGGGKSIMAGIHMQGDLAPRDIVARAITHAIAERRGAFLDATKSIGPRFSEKFPTVFESCQRAGIDPATQMIPIAPAAHYHMGGVRTDEDGRTSLKGLWAVGEVANVGLHGANRLASNSLLEAIVYGARIADSLKNDTTGDTKSRLGFNLARLDMDPAPATKDDMLALRHLMSTHMGMMRNKTSLREAFSFVDDNLIAQTANSGFNNALMTASILLSGAINRKESRGCHYRSDHTKQTDAHHSILWIDFNKQKPQYKADYVKRLTDQRGTA